MLENTIIFKTVNFFFFPLTVTSKQIASDLTHCESPRGHVQVALAFGLCFIV